MLAKQRLYIVGANVIGVELASEFLHDAALAQKYELVGFLHHGKAMDTSFLGLAIVGDWMDFSFQPNDVVFMATADIEWKKKVVAALSGKVEIATFIHERAQINKSAVIGKGCLIMGGVGIDFRVTIGDYVTLNPACLIGHGSVIGQYSTLLTGTNMCGNCDVGEDVLIGASATIAPKVRVGAGARIAIGSVVMSHVGEGEMVMGNPARVVCEKGESLA